jgi:hypothetical protein
MRRERHEQGRKRKRALRRAGHDVSFRKIPRSRHMQGRIAQGVGAIFQGIGKQMAAFSIGAWLRGFFGGRTIQGQ